MKRFKIWFKDQPKAKKVQFWAALIMTALCVVVGSAVAWFSQQRELKTGSYINAPINLYITATHESKAPKIDLGDINVERRINGEYVLYKNYVFCVRNINVEEYILQLACTTNTPFTYEIFKADYKGQALGSSTLDSNEIRSCTVSLDGTENTLTEDLTHVIHDDNEKNKVYGYEIYGDNILTHPINPDASNAFIANNDYRNKSYETYSKVQQNVNPMYYQTDTITGFDEYGIKEKNIYEDFSERSDYYVLRVKWTEEQINSHAVDNNKETDIIYITAGTKIQTTNTGN